VNTHRESEEKLARQAEEKTQELARQRGELIEEIEGEVIEAVEDRLDKLDTASAEVLDLEEGTPEALGVMLAKVAVVSACVRCAEIYSSLLARMRWMWADLCLPDVALLLTA